MRKEHVPTLNQFSIGNIYAAFCSWGMFLISNSENLTRFAGGTYNEQRRISVKTTWEWFISLWSSILSTFLLSIASSVANLYNTIHTNLTNKILSQQTLICSKLTIETRCEICLTFTTKAPEERHWQCCSLFWYLCC